MSVSDALISTAVQTLATDPGAREQLWTAMRAAGVPFPAAAPAPAPPPTAPHAPSWSPASYLACAIPTVPPGGLSSSPGTGFGFLPSDEKAAATAQNALMGVALPLQMRALEERNQAEMMRWRTEQDQTRLATLRAELERREREVMFQESGGAGMLKTFGIALAGLGLGGLIGWACGALSASRRNAR